MTRRNNRTTLSPTPLTTHHTVVKVSYLDETWVVERRYSQFVAVGKALASSLHNVPSLPAKHVLTTQTEGFIAQRREELERWLTTTVLLPEVWASSDALRSFLDDTGRFLALSKQVIHTPT